MRSLGLGSSAIFPEGVCMSDTVQRELSDGVLLLTLNRPHKKNAFNNAQWNAFSDALHDAKEDHQVAVVVVTGAGTDFCSGVDLSAFGGSDEDEQPFDRTARTVCEFDKPLLAAAKGVAIGGGATLLFHCDVVYVGQSLRLRLPFVSLGLVPEFGSSYRLQVNIGAQRAAELFYTAEWVDAARAVDVGIAAGSYPDEVLLEHTLSKAREIAQWPVGSLRATKRTLMLAHRAGLAAALQVESEGMRAQVGSPENVEAFRAFLEKRKPDFRKLREGEA